MYINSLFPIITQSLPLFTKLLYHNVTSLYRGNSNLILFCVLINELYINTLKQK